MADLEDIESYCDTVPRAGSTIEEIGPLTLFVSRGGFPYYARPRLGSTGRISTQDVLDVRARQRELGVPEAFEWVDALRPELAEAVTAAGLTVFRAPLMLQRRAELDATVPPGIRIRTMTADDPSLPAVEAAIGLGFSEPGTAIGRLGEQERRIAELGDASVHQTIRRRIAGGLTVVAGAFATVGPVAGGSHSPRDRVSEITGVATLSAFRRRGIGAALTAHLVADARLRNVRTCFLSAGSEAVARVYAKAGFELVGTACIAGAPV